MRIAIVGSGISGLVCGHLLHRAHEVTLFEADARIGGHTNTVDVRIDGLTMPVDTGFIVFNRRTYPRFTRLLESLGVAWQNSAMSFSVSCSRTGLEYGGEGLDGLFAQRGNLLRLDFLRMVLDILRFGRDAPRLAGELPEEATLGDLLERERYGRLFASHYLLPMGSAIWSASRSQMLEFPLRFFVSFFDNHGMLLPGTRPQWLTVAGGARTYVEAITRPWAERVALGCAVRRVSRDGSGVELMVDSSGRTRSERFDHVILACHSDQSLAMLSDPSPAEREVLGALPYAGNEAVLHTDDRLLPRSRRAWSAWNYHLLGDEGGGAVLTYNMTRLQSLPTARAVCVTLNRSGAIDASRVLGRWTYHHPQFSLAGIAAQRRRREISGVNRTSYAGAYWFNGFHEDGVRSAEEACAGLGVEIGGSSIEAVGSGSGAGVGVAT